MVLGPCGDKEDIACRKSGTLIVMDQHALAANDNIELVLVMRRLAVGRNREGEGDIERAAFERESRAFTGRPGDQRLGIGKADDAAAIGCINRPLPRRRLALAT